MSLDKITFAADPSRKRSYDDACAAAHALEQAQLGFRQLPFFELALDNDPGRKETV